MGKSSCQEQKQGEKIMSDGNKNNNGVHEVGTEETRLAYQNDTPGQQVERYLNTINQVIEEKKEKQKKAFTKVFDTPLKGFPYNEQNDAKSIAKMTGTREKAVQQFIDSNDIQGEKLLQKIKKDKKLAKDFAMALSGKPGNKMMKQFTEETVSEAMKIKDIFKKHKRELTKAYKTGDLSFSGSAGKKAEYDLTTWAMDNNEIKTDDPDEFFDWLSRDLEDIVKGKIREETITEAPKLKNLIPEFEKIVKTKGAAKVQGTMVDMFTASVIVKAYEQVNDKNKKRMETSNVFTLIKLAQKVMGMKEETVSEKVMGEEVAEAFSKTPKSGAEVAKMMMKSKTLKGFANKVKKMKTVTAVQLDKMLPDYVSGGDIGAMFEEVLDEGKMSELFLDIQQGATAKDIARDYPVTLAQAKDFLKDYYGQKKKPMNMGEGMQSSKLTGQEISVYFKRNKVRDAETRKAVEFALDHGGAYSYAIKGIEKMKKGLSKNKDVVKALNFANFGESVKVPSVGFQFKEDSPVAGNMQVEGDPYIPQKKGVNKNIANYWNKEIKGLKDKELEAIQSMYMITDHSGVVQMYKAGKRDFIKSIKS